jgi:hypothetical protein
MILDHTAEVYRFDNKVAFHTQNSQTIYLTKQLAYEFARAILKATEDIEDEPKFSLSHFTPIKLKDEHS